MDNLITWVTWLMPTLVVVFIISQLPIWKTERATCKKFQNETRKVLMAACISDWKPEVVKVAYLNGGNTSDPVDEDEVMAAGKKIAASGAYRKLVEETLQFCLKNEE